MKASFQIDKPRKAERRSRLALCWAAAVLLPFSADHDAYVSLQLPHDLMRTKHHAHKTGWAGLVVWLSPSPSPSPSRSGGVSVMQSERPTYGIPHLTPHTTSRTTSYHADIINSSKAKGTNLSVMATQMEKSLAIYKVQADTVHGIENKRQFIRLLRPCALVAACVHLLLRLYAGYPGYFAIKTNASKIRQWYQNERNRCSGISLNKRGQRKAYSQNVGATDSDPCRKSDEGWSRCKEKSNVRGYVEKFDPNVAPESCRRSKALSGGIGWSCGQTRELRYLCFSVIPSWLSLRLTSSHQTLRSCSDSRVGAFRSIAHTDVLSGDVSYSGDSGLFLLLLNNGRRVRVAWTRETTALGLSC